MSNVELGIQPERYTDYVPKPIPYNPIDILPQVQNDPNKISHLISTSHQFDPAYLGWDLVRTGGNLEMPGYLTGFEVYFAQGLPVIEYDNNVDAIERYNASPLLTPYKRFSVHMDKVNPRIVHDLIAEHGSYIKNSIPRHARMTYYDTLTGDKKPNIGVLLDLEGRFKATLARLSARANLNPAYKLLRSEIRTLTMNEKIGYELRNNAPAKEYLPKLKLGSIFSYPQEYEANDLDPSGPYGLMMLIGKIGHTLTRTALESLPEEAVHYYLSKLHATNY